MTGAGYRSARRLARGRIPVSGRGIVPLMTEPTDDEKRRDQLLRAEGSTERDAAPRITVGEHDGTPRVDIAPDAVVRPGPGAGTDEATADDETRES